MKYSFICAFTFLLPLILATLTSQEEWPSVPGWTYEENVLPNFDDQILGASVKEIERSSDDNDDDSKGLSEYAPIQNTIGQSGIQYYSFNVNASTGLGEYFEYLVFVTGNICSQPEDSSASNDNSLVVYYSFNASMLKSLENSQMSKFSNGYFQALAEVSVTETSSVLYMAVQAPQSTNLTDSWSYEIGVSQNDLVYQWDSRSFIDIVDTDAASALIVTGNLTSVAGKTNVSEYNSSLSNYQLLVFPETQKNHFATLNESWCAVRNGPSLALGNNYATSYTTRGGRLRQQFYVSGLNASTKYVGYLLSDFSDQRGSVQGGTLYAQFEFETLGDNACKLVYDLDFCDEVAYSVPASSLAEYESADALKQLYDDEARNLFSNFSKALQQIPCNTTKDAVFSPVGSCQTCNTSYKNWLCAVTIPRCSTRNITGYLYRSANASRNAFIDENVVPVKDYYEVLPCVNVCQVMTRDCPADFGFACPRTNNTIKLSYFWDEGGEYASCNFVGRAYVLTNSAHVLKVAWTFVLMSITMVFMAA